MSTFNETEYVELLERQLDALESLEVHTVHAQTVTREGLPPMSHPLIEAFTGLQEAADVVLSTTKLLFEYVDAQLDEDSAIVIKRGERVSIKMTDGDS